MTLTPGINLFLPSDCKIIKTTLRPDGAAVEITYLPKPKPRQIWLRPSKDAMCLPELAVAPYSSDREMRADGWIEFIEVMP